jgi:hypothetical protein
MTGLACQGTEVGLHEKPDRQLGLKRWKGVVWTRSLKVAASLSTMIMISLITHLNLMSAA